MMLLTPSPFRRPVLYSKLPSSHQGWWWICTEPYTPVSCSYMMTFISQTASVAGICHICLLWIHLHFLKNLIFPGKPLILHSECIWLEWLNPQTHSQCPLPLATRATCNPTPNWLCNPPSGTEMAQEWALSPDGPTTLSVRRFTGYVWKESFLEQRAGSSWLTGMWIWNGGGHFISEWEEPI